MILLPDENIVDRRTAFQLERAYSKLPREFEGYQRNYLHPVGGARHGVIRISDFVLEKTGIQNGLLTDDDWMTIPESSLAEMVNGKVYFDGPGYLSTSIDRGSRWRRSRLRCRVTPLPDGLPAGNAGSGRSLMGSGSGRSLA